MKSISRIGRYFIGAGVFVVLSMMMLQLDKGWDLTSDARYTLHPLAKEMARSIDEPITITVYLHGNVPASFRNYQKYIEYYVSELRRHHRSTHVIYTDPSYGSIEERNALIQFLSEQGIEPIKRQVGTQDELSQSIIYPYISINDSEEMVFINLLEPPVPGRGEEGDLLASQLAFESKFLRALRRLIIDQPPSVHVIGHKSQLIAEGYNRDPRIGGFKFIASNAEILRDKREEVNAIVVAAKSEDLKREELLAIDLLAVDSIPVLWLIDKFSATLDSLRQDNSFLAVAKDFIFEDYIFQKGVRINPVLIQDLRSTQIPQVTNSGGSNARTIAVNYPYHPVYVPEESAPVETRVSAPVSLFFTSELELLDYPKEIVKTPLIQTSPYTQKRESPVPLDFSWLTVTPSPEDYGGGVMNIGVKILGSASAYFKNRLTNEDRDFLMGEANAYLSTPKWVHQLIIADADFAIPPRGLNGKYWPVGYNLFERHMYEGNAQLISNLLEGMVYGNEILNVAEKESNLSLLDITSFDNKANYYYFLLIGVPSLLLSTFYFIFHFYRRRKYATT